MKTINLNSILLISIMIIGFCSCSTFPKGAVAVDNFNKEKYLGKWYEIARLDFKFEKNLNNTTAEYSLNENGTIKVDNNGYNTMKKKWVQSIGKAKFVNDDTQGMLKVSFFGPFYGGYNVIAIDSDYQYALIVGSNLKYLWFLSRETFMPKDIVSKYLKIAQGIRYNTDDLIWVEHDK
jgi:apolipoprotein D and lipocalin family protein